MMMGTFYHYGKTLSAKICFYVKVKLLKDSADMGLISLEEISPFKVINKVNEVTLKKVLFDEAKIK